MEHFIIYDLGEEDCANLQRKKMFAPWKIERKMHVPYHFAEKYPTPKTVKTLTNIKQYSHILKFADYQNIICMVWI